MNKALLKKNSMNYATDISACAERYNWENL